MGKRNACENLIPQLLTSLFFVRVRLRCFISPVQLFCFLKVEVFLNTVEAAHSIETNAKETVLSLNS